MLSLSIDIETSSLLEEGASFFILSPRLLTFANPATNWTCSSAKRGTFFLAGEGDAISMFVSFAMIGILFLEGEG